MQPAHYPIKFTLSLLFLIITANLLCAQEKRTDSLRTDSLQQRFFSLKGHVVGGDSKEILPGAYIYVGKKKTAVMTTGRQGEFKIPRLPEGELQLSVSYIGYQNFSKVYHMKGDLDIGEIILRPTILDEVVIKAIPPLSVQRGDTTQFNTAALKVAVDADLEDLLKKLPGFEIVDGKIMAQGKEVTKLYIDGMEYSFNDPAAALKNLPAKLVNKIKMYDDRSEEAKFSGYDDGEKFRSLNIETHNPRQIKMFGHASVGYGITNPLKNTFKENNYNASLSTNLFDQKRKITLSGDVQNTGQDNHLPGSRYQGKGGDNSSQSVYANFSSKLGKKLMFSGNGRLSWNNSYAASLSKQVYFPTDRYENRIYDHEGHSWEDGKSQSLNIRTEYDINKANRITFSPVFSLSDSHSRSFDMGGNIENNDTINTSHTQSLNSGNNLRTGGNLSWIHVFPKKGRTLTLRIDGAYNHNLSEQSQINRERSLNNQNIYTDTLRNLFITNHREGYNWSTALTWSEPLNEHARLSFNYTFRENADFSDKESLSYKDEEFKDLIGIDSAQTNKLENLYRVHNYGVNYNYFFKKFRFKAGMTVSHTQMDNRYKYPGKVDSLMKSIYTDVSPLLNVDLELGENSKLEMMYRGNSSSPNAVQLQDILDVTNPLQISIGNPDLKKSYNHRIGLNYTRSVSEKSIFFYSFFTVSQTLNQIASNVKFIQRDTVINDYTVIRGARLTTPVNLNGMWNVAANMNCSFPWKKLKVRFNTSLSYNFSHTPSIYDDLKNLTDSHVGGMEFTIYTDLSEDFDLNVSTRSSYSYSRNSTTGGSQYFNENINAYSRWIFWKGFLVYAQYDGSFYVNKKGETVNQTEHILNVGVGKKIGKNRQLEISLAANDILQERNSVNYSLNDLYAETSYQTMPSSYYLLSFSYRFNSMDKVKK